MPKRLRDLVAFARSMIATLSLDKAVAAEGILDAYIACALHDANGGIWFDENKWRQLTNARQAFPSVSLFALHVPAERVIREAVLAVDAWGEYECAHWCAAKASRELAAAESVRGAA